MHGKTGEPDKRRIQRKLRRQALVFFSAFVLIVLGLLIGYRYAKSTKANDWYLFQVARHTAAALSLLSHKASLEESVAYQTDPRRARATLSALERGVDTPTPEEIESSSSRPLRPWEAYRLRALRTRLSQPSQETGPLVTLIWQSGVLTRLREVSFEILELRRDTTLDRNLKRAQYRALAREKANLEKQRDQILIDPEGQESLKGKQFAFIVVPECGAIEIMAIFFAAVAAFPTGWRKRLAGLLLGLPIMYGVNILRLSCLAIIGALTDGGPLFDFAHEYLWQSVYIVFVVGAWLTWAEYFVRRRTP